MRKALQNLIEKLRLAFSNKDLNQTGAILTKMDRLAADGDTKMFSAYVRDKPNPVAIRAALRTNHRLVVRAIRVDESTS